MTDPIPSLRERMASLIGSFPLHTDDRGDDNQVLHDAFSGRYGERTGAVYDLVDDILAELSVETFFSKEPYAQGFHAGMMEAARTLREAAEDHRNQARASRKVLETQAHELGAALLGSWANGLEINANTSMARSPDRDG